MIASSMPSLFSSTGSLAIVAFGNATPFTTTVAGSISTTGSKTGFTVALLNTKICIVAGVVALMLKGGNAVSTPIVVVIAFGTGTGRVIREVSIKKPAPARLRPGLNV